MNTKDIEAVLEKMALELKHGNNQQQELGEKVHQIALDAASIREAEEAAHIDPITQRVQPPYTGADLTKKMQEDEERKNPKRW